MNDAIYAVIVVQSLALVGVMIALLVFGSRAIREMHNKLLAICVEDRSRAAQAAELSPPSVQKPTETQHEVVMSPGEALRRLELDDERNLFGDEEAA